MTTLNFLWPRWAELVTHLPVGRVRSWRTIQKAAALLANRFGREQGARSHRLLWEERAAPRELWARPPHRIRPRLPYPWRGMRHFLGLALAFCLSDLPATASPLEERDAAAGATEYSDDDDQAEEPGRLYKALGWAAFGVSAGDFASTEWVLAEGGRELNPFMQRRGVRIGASVAWAPAMNYLTEELRKDGHPKLALWMRIAVTGLKGYAIVHNLREAAR